jgi:branched-chain amino acid transport system permease protein
MTRLFRGTPARGWVLAVALLAVLVIAPRFANDYLLTILILILYFAYAGQAWNIMMGFAGQLSLGHAIYVGLGAYTSAALYVHFGVAPWLGMLVAVPVAMACGAIIGFLAFRFGVADHRVRRVRAHRFRPHRLHRRFGRFLPAGRAVHAE